MSSEIVQALEFAWAQIQENHDDIPGVILVTGRRRQKSEASTRGQHCSEVWRVDGKDDRVSEVVLFGERLAEGARAVLNTLIHEAVHEACRHRGVKDTSNRNRYHNRAFAKVAKSMGLEPPKSGQGRIGYSDCQITDETCELYADALKRLEAACKSWVAPRLTEQEKPKRSRKRIAQCECPEGQNEIPWSKKLAERSELTNGIICGACRSAFTEVEEDEDD